MQMKIVFLITLMMMIKFGHQVASPFYGKLERGVSDGFIAIKSSRRSNGIPPLSCQVATLLALRSPILGTQYFLSIVKKEWLTL
jgi:hypothetical protein